MNIRPLSQRSLTGLALTLCGAAFLLLLFYRGFTDPDEGRYSEIPREMVERGDWSEIRMLGYRYYEKPPLTYWLVAPTIRLLGAHDWAVRIPLLINAILLMLLLAGFARNYWGLLTGWQALLICLSTFGFVAGSVILLTDAFLMLWFAVTAIGLFEAFQSAASASRRNYYLALATAGAILGVLTKGAVAVVLPGVILAFWLLWERRFKALGSFRLLAAAIVGVLILAPVLWWLEQHNPEFFRQFIFEEHIARFTGTRRIQVHDEPFWFYAKVLPLLLLPWTLFVFRAGHRLVTRRGWRTDSLTRFLLVWTAVTLIFFSISTGKLMSYILPAMPALGLLLGRWGVAEPIDHSRTDRWCWNLGLAGLFLTAGALALLWILSYGQVLPDTLYPVRGISIVALLALVLVLALVLWRRQLGQVTGLVLFHSGILLATALLLSPLAGKDFNVLLHLNSSHVYQALARILKPADVIVVPWSYRPALPFYTRRLYVPFDVQNELEYGMALEPDRPRDLQTKAELLRLLESARGRVYAVVEPCDYYTKFLPLNLPFRKAPVPSDPETRVFELLPPASNAPAP